MSKLAVALVVCALAVSIAGATSIPVGETDLIGYRTTAAGGGLVGGGGWASDKGFMIAWDISCDAGEQDWDYAYTLTAINGSDLKKNVDHMLLEVNSSVTNGNYKSFFFEGNPAPDAPQTYVAGGNNHNLPGSIYAVELAGGDNVHFSFESTLSPSWGDFYVKDGPGNGDDKTAWNAGFGTVPSADGPFTDWIPVPDTLTVVNDPPSDPPSDLPSDPSSDDSVVGVPEPASLTLLGLGLLGAMVRRKVRKG